MTRGPPRTCAKESVCKPVSNPGSSRRSCSGSQCQFESQASMALGICQNPGPATVSASLSFRRRQCATVAAFTAHLCLHSFPCQDLCTRRTHGSVGPGPMPLGHGSIQWSDIVGFTFDLVTPLFSRRRPHCAIAGLSCLSESIVAFDCGKLRLRAQATKFLEQKPLFPTSTRNSRRGFQGSR